MWTGMPALLLGTLAQLVSLWYFDMITAFITKWYSKNLLPSTLTMVILWLKIVRVLGTASKIIPYCRLRFKRICRISIMPCGSSPLIGSSNTKNLGFPTKAIAIPNRSLIPKLKFFAFFLPYPPSPPSSEVEEWYRMIVVPTHDTVPLSFRWPTYPDR